MTPNEKAALTAALSPLRTAATALAAAIDNLASTLANATTDTGTQPPTGTVKVSLSVSNVAKVGDKLPVVGLFTNNTPAAINMLACAVAVRQPGATHAAGPFDQDVAGPTGALAVGASRTVSGTFTPSKEGKYTVYATYQDANGWHDGPDTVVTVSAGTGGGPVDPPAGGGGSSGGSTGGGSAGSGTLINPVPGSGPFLGAQLWFLGDWATPGVFKSGVNWGDANTSPWSDGLIAALAPYKVFRNMDVNAVNWSTAKSWSARRSATDTGNASAAITDASEAGKTGMAYERQIQLCNAANLDYWCCVPAQVDDDYVVNLAKLIASKLNANLRVYLEYSNETWNGQFSQFNYVNSQGNATGAPGSNDYYKGGAYTLIRCLQMAKLFDQNGITQSSGRLVPVFAFSGNTDIGVQAAANVGNASKYNSGMKVGLVCSAPYVESVGSLASFKSQTTSRMKDPMAAVVQVAKTLGCASGTYEGGPGAYSGGDTFRAQAWSYDAILDWYQQLGKLVNGPICNYTLIGKWGSTAWGHYDHVGQSLTEAHGARAALDWVNGKK